MEEGGADGDDAAAALEEVAPYAGAEEAADHQRQDTMEGVSAVALAAADIAAAWPCPDYERTKHAMEIRHTTHADEHSPHRAADEEGADCPIAHQ